MARQSNRTEYTVKQLWLREEGVRRVIGYRAQALLSGGRHRWAGPPQETHHAADADARTAAQRAAGLVPA